MRKSNRSEEQIQLVEDYCKANMLWRTGEEKITYTDTITLDLSSIEPTVAGPKRPQDKILLKNFKNKFIELMDKNYGRKYAVPDKQLSRWFAEGGGQPVDPAAPD